MTEIPEHLLERTRSRRIALGLPVSGDDGGGGGAAPVAAADGGAVVAASEAAPLPKGPATPDVPVEAAPAKPVPVAPYIQAAEKRRRIPSWALPVLALMPVWAFIYAGTLSPVESGELTPIEEGAELYNANCATCHGSGGGGGVGPALSDGAVLSTFSNPADHLRWVVLGSAGATDGVYGDTGTESEGGMPAFGAVLTEEELLLIIRHERETLSGEAPSAEAWITGLAAIGPSVGLSEERSEHLLELIEKEELVPAAEEEGDGGEEASE